MFAIDQTKTDQRPKNLDGGIFLLVITGLRYYTLRLGRWASRDPIGRQGGMNTYAMVQNDPVRRWDVLGLLTHERPTGGLWLGMAGEFSYFTAWKLGQTYTHFGFVTQRVRTQGRVWNQSGTLIESWDYKYTEAWAVWPGKDRTDGYLNGGAINPGGDSDSDVGWPSFGAFQADDEFASDGYGRCTTGWIYMYAGAAYYDNTDIPDDWTTDGVPDSGGLPATMGWVTLGPDVTEGLDIKWIKVHWNCLTGTCETRLDDIL